MQMLDIRLLQELSHYYATDNLMLVVVVTLGGAAAIGHVLDKALGDLAFGIVGNACLVLMSMIVAVSLARSNVNLITYDESARFAILASSLSTGLILGMGALKAYLLRCKI